MKKAEYLYAFSILKSMFKVLITITLILILTTSIYSQTEAKGVGGFRGGSFGGGKSFSSNSIPMGTGQGKMFTTSPSGKINPQETAQQGPKQTASSSPSSSSGSSNNPQNNFKPQPSFSSQSQFQQQPRSNFFGGGVGGGLGGFGNMIMASIMGNFIGQALFGWMLPHPTPVADPAQTQSSPVVAANNGTSNNQIQK